MYESFFGLREAPFRITPDTGYAYACASHQDALNTLVLAVSNGEGFVKLTGEVGTGKTMLCRRLLATLDADRYPESGEARWRTAYIPNPYLEPRALLLAVLEELGGPGEGAPDTHLLFKRLQRALLEYARKGQRVVLCLDEAQAMPLATLEALRLLTNLETEKRKLLQVVLFGQPELDGKLAHRAIRQLRQRITFQHILREMTRDDLDAYLRHRLTVAGYTGQPLFEPSAVRLLYRASRGVPRLVNVLAHKAMFAAYGEGSRAIQKRHLRIAAADTPEARMRLLPWKRLLPQALRMVRR